MSNNLRLAIVGSGAIGLAMTADCTLAGHDAYLYELPEFQSCLPDGGCFMVTGLTFRAGYIEEPRQIQATIIYDLAKFRDLRFDAVIVTTTAQAHTRLLPTIAASTDQGVPIIVICGDGSTIVDVPTRPLVCESNTAPYGARRVPNGISIKILTPSFGLAGRTLADVGPGLSILQSIYPEAFAFKHWVDALLSNPNPMMHPTIMLANLTSIDAARSFAFYDQGVTPAVMQLLRRKDNERMAINDAIGGRAVPFDDFEGVVRMDGQLVPQHFLTCGRWTGILAPTTTNDRYFTEDVPYGLVVWEALANQVRVPTPIITAEIEQISALLNRDCRAAVSRRTTVILESVIQHV